jgi:hypothetical protein
MVKLSPKIVVVLAIVSLACTTKVSEWVLLNALPDQYRLVYFHENELSAAEKKQHAELINQLGRANIILRTKQSSSIEKAYYALYFKNRLVGRYADKSELLNIATSPLRKEIAGELLEGKLCVMLYLKCGDPDEDSIGLKELKTSIAASPFGEVITVLELDREHLGERVFVSMLLNVESDLKSINEPMLFGIFGKFRALEPLLAKGINQNNIRLMIDFLTADCSCLIKDDLPGVSMLYSGEWDNPKTALVNEIIDANPHLEHR